MRQNTLIVTIAILLSNFASAAFAADSEEAILLNNYQARANKLYESFYSDTFTQRLSIDYSETYRKSDSAYAFERRLKSYSRDCTRLLESLTSLYNRIETYPGKDWESRYGSTNIWNDCKKLRLKLNWLNANINLYQTKMVTDPDLREYQASELLDDYSSLLSKMQPQQANLFKAKLQLLAAGNDRKLFSQAINTLKTIADSDRISPGSYFSANILLLQQNYSTQQTRKLLDQIRKSSLDDEVELTLKLSLLAYKNGNHEFLENCFLNWPASLEVTSKIFLNCCVNESGQITSPCTTDSFTADVIAFGLNLENSANDKLRDNKEHFHNFTKAQSQLILSRLIDQPDMQTRMVLYSCAVILWDAAPEKTIELLLTAGQNNLMRLWYPKHLQRDSLLELACRYSYELIAKSNAYNSVAFDALERYSKLENSSKDSELEYLLASELLDKNFTDAKIVLNKIAADKANKYSAKAKLDLLMYDYINLDLSADQLKSLSAEARPLLTKFSHNSEEYNNLLILYVSASMDTQSQQLMQTAYKSLADINPDSDPAVVILKAQLACMVGKHCEAVTLLSDCVYKNKPLDQPTAVYVLDQVLNRYEQITVQASRQEQNNKLCFNDRLAAIAHKIELKNSKTKISALKVEAIVISGSKISNDYGLLSVVSPDDINILRVKARNAMACGKYDESAVYWGKIAVMLKRSKQNYGWRWARAKYYQFYCYSKNTDFDENELKRAINIVLNEPEKIEEFWRKKIAALLG